jgi:hypothetical protein
MKGIGNRQKPGWLSIRKPGRNQLSSAGKNLPGRIKKRKTPALPPV